MIVKHGMEVEYDLFRRMLAAHPIPWVDAPEAKDTFQNFAEQAKIAAEVAREAGFVEVED